MAESAHIKNRLDGCLQPLRSRLPTANGVVIAGLVDNLTSPTHAARLMSSPFE